MSLDGMVRAAGVDRRGPLQDAARIVDQSLHARMGAEPTKATASVWAGMAPVKALPSTTASRRHGATPTCASWRGTSSRRYSWPTCVAVRPQRLSRRLPGAQTRAYARHPPRLLPARSRFDGHRSRFYLALTVGLEEDPISALERTVGFIETTARSEGVDDAVQGSFGISDGASLWAVRYATDGRPRSLFASADVDSIRRLHPDNAHARRLSREDRVIVSEPCAVVGRWSTSRSSRSARRRSVEAARVRDQPTTIVGVRYRPPRCDASTQVNAERAEVLAEGLREGQRDRRWAPLIEPGDNACVSDKTYMAHIDLLARARGSGAEHRPNPQTRRLGRSNAPPLSPGQRMVAAVRVRARDPLAGCIRSHVHGRVRSRMGGREVVLDFHRTARAVENETRASRRAALRGLAAELVEERRKVAHLRREITQLKAQLESWQCTQVDEPARRSGARRPRLI